MAFRIREPSNLVRASMRNVPPATSTHHVNAIDEKSKSTPENERIVKIVRNKRKTDETFF